MHGRRTYALTSWLMQFLAATLVITVASAALDADDDNQSCQTLPTVLRIENAEVNVLSVNLIH